MYKKKFVGAIIGVFCVLTLIACGAREEQLVTSEKGKNENVENTVKTEGAVILASNSAHMMMATTEEGLYRIANEEIADGVWANKIYYVDYASAKEIVLCSDTSCRHNSENCTGIVFDDELINPEVFVYNNKVYIYSTQDDSNATSTVIDASGGFELVSFPAKLYEMNLDGTNRRLVKEFDSEYTMGETVMAWNGKLIFFQKTLENKEDENGSTYYYAVDCKLVSLDLSNGDLKELMSLSDEYILEGTYKNYLVCGKTNYADGYTAEDANKMDFAEWRDLMNRSTEQYVLIDLESGKETSLYEISNKDLKGCIVQGENLYINNGTKQVISINLNTKDVATIEMDDEYVMVKSVGDRIYCWKEGNSQGMYFWDPFSNEMENVDMKIKGTNLAAEIIAYTKENIVMICDGEYKTSSLDSDAYEVLSTKFGIHKKEDLYHGKTDCVPVEMCSKGVTQ